jgi:hypothetical protein
MRASFIMWNMQRRPFAGLAHAVADGARRTAHREPPSPKFSSVLVVPR